VVRRKGMRRREKKVIRKKGEEKKSEEKKEIRSPATGYGMSPNFKQSRMIGI